ncbi:GNAT family N-acetyltransferase [Glacieibacterium frigidum]|uniref:GNAT family N-acetyltransferase n=2 Tax=Glacieibacterium frigidum TaxID=2593303 RepID=A0A552UAQ7_9SPHN|nr:GNAT family N-acetyltransferase [Glacieibacterium frigidum]
MGRLPAPMTANYLELIEAGSVWVLAAEDDVTGLIVLRQADDHLLVSNVAVGSAQQGLRLGRALLDHAETHARRSGIHELRLYTHELMHENLAIYTRLGWEEYGRGEQDGFSRIFMQKRLAPELDRHSRE